MEIIVNQEAAMPTALKAEGTREPYYTYADYRGWDTKERYEIIDGTAYMMGAPSITHQAISRELLLQFGNFLKGKPCQVFTAPLDVRLFPEEDESDDTIVQPDLLVVCDKSKLADVRSCRGAPDMVIEILSPSNSSGLVFLKFQKYLKAGVREYWAINPENRIIQVHLLEKPEGALPVHYISGSYENPAALDVTVLPGLRIDFTDLWGAG
ncbi:MAG: Uma2 family endonuclease [Spirochaetaceae bacterium]|jgi:Uma2 family endonuclease|nr:Uma2 family endonuclease [Spirochaetaceae bacterium]